MPARVSGYSQPSIDYTLNLLGIRVWERSCVLIAKSGWEWKPLGPPRALPIQVPRRAEDLKPSDELSMTAYQFHLECPESDLIEVLEQQKSFDLALRTCPLPAFP